MVDSSPVTFVIGSLGPGGAERVVSLMANHWAGHGRPVRIITLDSGNSHYTLHPAVEHIRLGSISASGAVDRARQGLVRLATLRRLLRRAPEQLVVSFIDVANVHTLVATRGTKHAVVVSERTDPREHHIGLIWRVLRRLLYSRAAVVVVQSPDVLTYFPSRVRKRCLVIPNPVLPQALAAARSEGQGRIVALGRLTYEKGFDLLLRAFAQIAPDVPGWQVHIWGDGRHRKQLEQLRDELALQGLVTFCGLTRDPIARLCEGDLFVLPSRYEGFPNALGEAMACGMPVVAFDCPSGPRQLIRHDVDGLLVRPADVDALAESMKTLIYDSNRRRRLAARAPEVVQRFSLDRVMGLWHQAEAQAKLCK